MNKNRGNPIATKTRLRGGNVEPVRRDSDCWDERDSGPQDQLFNLDGDPTRTSAPRADQVARNKRETKR